ncbi:cytochrome P450 87A3 isoform X1 [Cinnamomum micranthum f. kanehirae]|uniref:Cytochrome P450 87A3 isoform X1 n=1 Tax=Cinnamomum micranthum f. kanehirae TaxID=337451 RepID=A0A443PKV3_9MAGN|nr:cytochrome P450 87A3 isoform X1 [Cinnamomum micranthum f. kanehirae]
MAAYIAEWVAGGDMPKKMRASCAVDRTNHYHHLPFMSGADLITATHVPKLLSQGWLKFFEFRPFEVVVAMTESGAMNFENVVSHCLFIDKSWYPDTFTEIFGRQNVGSIHGFMYKYIKSLILSLFAVESLKEHLLPEINRFARTTLTSWSGQPSIEVKDATAAMIFELTAKKLISYDPITCSSNLNENFVAFIEGLISFPINIPGTAYYKCIQGQKNAMRVLKKMIEERRFSPERRKGDFFDRVIDELQKDRSMLMEVIALDLIFVLLFASYETTSLALTMAIKYLSEHPQLLDKLTVLNETVRLSKKLEISLVAGKKKN